MINNKTGTIYALIDPNTNLVRYIGQTYCNVKKRYNQHIYQWKREKGKIRHSTAWIKSLAKMNQKPILEIIEEDVDIKYLNSKEIHYIRFFKSIGAKLCNHSIGGNSNRGCKMSEESKLKRLETLKKSKAWKEKGKLHSEIMKKRHADGLVIPPVNLMSEEARIKKGKEHSIKLKEKYKNNPSCIEKLTSSRKKKIRSINIITNEELIFESLKLACTYFNFSHTSIIPVCRKIKDSYKNIKFEYLTK